MEQCVRLFLFASGIVNNKHNYHLPKMSWVYYMGMLCINRSGNIFQLWSIEVHILLMLYSNTHWSPELKTEFQHEIWKIQSILIADQHSYMLWKSQMLPSLVLHKVVFENIPVFLINFFLNEILRLKIPFLNYIMSLLKILLDEMLVHNRHPNPE